MGVIGAAWSTVLGPAGRRFAVRIVLIRQISGIKTEQKPAVFDFRLFRDMVRIAVPSIFSSPA